MKIPSKFPQFEGEKVLIAVTGSQEADIYFASNGVIDKIVSFRIPRRKYSDDEGYFASKSRVGKKRSGVVVSGAAREYPKQAAIQDFLNRLEDELKKVSNPPAGGEKISYICLFSPDYMMKMVKSAFPAEFKNKIRISIAGNYSGHRPFELLEKINLKIRKII